MLRLREMFEAEAADHRSGQARRLPSRDHRVHHAPARTTRTTGRSRSSAVAQYVPDPVAEFGASTDPFENWLLANVLYYKHQPLHAAKYFTEAAQHRPLSQGLQVRRRYLLSSGPHRSWSRSWSTQIADQPGNPDAQWASYMRFKIPRLQWERGGKSNAAAREAVGRRRARTISRLIRTASTPSSRAFAWASGCRSAASTLEAIEAVSAGCRQSGYYDFTARLQRRRMLLPALVAKADEGAGAPPARTPSPRPRWMRCVRDAIKALARRDQPRAAGRTRRADCSAASSMTPRPRHLHAGQPAGARRHRGRLSRNRRPLAGYEDAYPAMSDHFSEDLRMAAGGAGPGAAIGRDSSATSQALVERNAAAITAHNDFIKEIGADFWRGALAGAGPRRSESLSSPTPS